MKKNEFSKFNLQLFGLPEDEAVEILHELDRDHYLNSADRIEVAKLAQLKRIADILEDMNSALIGINGSVEELEKCVGFQPARRRGYVNAEGFHFLRIGGQVDTD